MRPATKLASLVSRLGAALALTGLALAGPACLPINNVNPVSRSASDSSTVDVETLSTTLDDGAKAPCTLYDASNATRGICRTCYNTLLGARCPGKSDFSKCADPSIRVPSQYVPLVNQCIASTVEAGFTCLKTCSSGLVLDSRTCTCVPPTTHGTFTGSILYVDVGQSDFGPPIVGAAFPSAGATGQPTPTPVPTACVGTLPVYFGVMNRGDTVFRLNLYPAPTPTASSNHEDTPRPYIESATQPRALEAAEIPAGSGANAVSVVTFRTGSAGEVVGAKGAIASFIKTVSGATSDGVTYAGDGGQAVDAQWTSPGFGARDGFGNVYFSDTLQHAVRVICNARDAGSAICPVADLGEIKLVAGTPGTPGTGDLLRNPHGVAVDDSGNVYIADTGNHAIKRYPAAGGALTVVAGTEGSTGGVATDRLDNPYGIDLRGPSGGAYNIYIADSGNHAIRVFCNYADTVCAAPHLTHILTLVGDGSPGWAADSENYVVPAAAPAAGVGQARNPSDVKLTQAGNIVYSDTGNHLLRGLCFVSTGSDFCKDFDGTAPNGNDLTTIAGRYGAGQPMSGYGGHGSTARQALLTYPTQVAIARGQFTADHADFPDGNIVFTERLYAPSLFAGRPYPRAVSGLTGVTDMYLGPSHTCARDGAGAVRCVGDNTTLQLGRASTAGSSSTAAVVSGMGSGFARPGGGTGHTCAMASNFLSAQCWGGNSAGQLGNGSLTNSATPVTVAFTDLGGTGLEAIAGGDSHTCAASHFTTPGRRTVRCWGENASGQLGNNSLSPSLAPVLVNSGLTAIQDSNALAAGANHTCMATTNQQVHCWGANNAGQLGDSSTTTRSSPVQAQIPVAPTGNWEVEAAGDHTCARESGGTNRVYCWGSNDFGESGSGTLGTPVQAPAAPILAGASDLALGTSHGCALLSATRVACWGSNAQGQLGNDEIPYSSAPVSVVNLPSGSISGIWAGGNQTCAVVSGVPYCWGDNTRYQLGPNPAGTTATGNLLRIICGDNSAAIHPTAPAAGSAGLCQGVTASGVLYTLAGANGVAGSNNAGEGRLASSATFAKLFGVTYDRYKNLVVSSLGFVSRAGAEYKDFSLRRVLSEVTGPVAAVKYSFTDSNTQTSSYCLRFKPRTACDSAGACECRMVPPVDEANPNFWSAITQTATCQ